MKKSITGASFLFFFASVFAQQNTILIIADDLSPDYLGFYSSTTDTARIPNIRALLAKGIQFNNVWASPVCSPTRAGILTGRYPFRTGVGTVIVNASSAQLDTAEMSIAKLLKYEAPAHYNTANVGKWHLHVSQPQKRLFPNKMGYDYYSGNFNGQITDYYNYPKITNGKVDTVKIYATTQTVNDALGWMDTMNKSKPFFLWLAFNAPHSPFHLPSDSLITYTGLSGSTGDINANPKKYFMAAIEAMDAEIGRLFKYLKAHNIYNNTNIIFIGDNGNETQVAQITDTKKSKATLYDYGVHVPMVISGPSVLNPGRKSDALINTPDLFATIAEMSGIANWRNYIPKDKTVDSRSIMPIIKDQLSSTRNWIFTEQFESPTVAADGKTIRNDNYQLIRFSNGTEEFYNQSTDSEENSNLLNTTMTATEINNYIFLCDSLNALLGSGTCKSLGVRQPNATESIIVFPNPARESLYIRSDVGFKRIKISNYLGETFYDGIEKNISITGIPSGFYFVTVSFENKRIIEKILICH